MSICYDDSPSEKKYFFRIISTNFNVLSIEKWLTYDKNRG